MGENTRKVIDSRKKTVGGTSATNQVNWQQVSNMHGHQKKAQTELPK